MVDVPTFQVLEEKMLKFNLTYYQATICKNIKRIRKQLFEENKLFYKSHNLQNPYSAAAVAELLDITYEYYKRIESYDKNKPISLKLFIKIYVLFGKDISEYLK